MTTTQAIYQGNNLDLLSRLPDCSVDAVVTDPPYGLSFMGKDWDAALPDPRTWSECLRVLKPGGHLVAFGAPRLYHRLACQIEDAGFEMRDCLLWLFGSGFPKSLDVSKAIDAAAGAEREVVGTRTKLQSYGANDVYGSGPDKGGVQNITAPATPAAKQWAGYGTALKPAYEPIVLARKPLSGTVAANVLAYGTGALNIDGCRIETEDNLNGGAYSKERQPSTSEWAASGSIHKSTGAEYVQPAGRWPANLILDEDAGAMLDAQSGVRRPGEHPAKRGATMGYGGDAGTESGVRTVLDSGGASRFFYCAKAARSEREAGLDHLPPRVVDPSRDPENGPGSPSRGAGRSGEARRNHHATVKPLDLMRWLVRLVTPPGGIVLEPFAGSGTTLVACALEGRDAIGMELDPEYVTIGRARVEHARGTS